MIYKQLHKIILKVFLIFLHLNLSILITSCIKIEREPKVITEIVSEITTYSAQAQGKIIDIGEGISNYGHCWSLTSNPDLSDSFTSLGPRSSTGSFTSNLQNLLSGTTYYVRAYLKCGAKVVFGDEINFTTLIGVPTLTTTAISTITATTATAGGNITADGGAAVTERGVCWGTSSGPTISGSHVASGSGIGTFTSNLTGLTPGTTYYVRAYATNSAGTAYGNERTFTTLAGLPVVTTNTVSAITQTSATSGGNVTSDGGAAVTERGVCWSTSPGPTITGSHTNDGSGSGIFSSNITGLTPGTLYYVRAYASNIVGIAYGNQIQFNTQIVDIEGNAYNTVTIGTQTWMAENLRTTKFTDGTNIPLVTDSTLWSNLVNPGYCWYYNDAAKYKNIYGALYNWYTVNTGKLCPEGWHAPTDSEWKQLEMYLGMSPIDADGIWERGTNEGDKLKEAGISHWIGPNNGTNISGFTALPGGQKGHTFGFWGLGQYGCWWTSTIDYSDDAWYRYLQAWTSGIGRSRIHMRSGNSVRCVKD